MSVDELNKSSTLTGADESPNTKFVIETSWSKATSPAASLVVPVYDISMHAAMVAASRTLDPEIHE